MIIQKFDSSAVLEDKLLSLIEVNLRIETKSSNEVKVLLSGGACSLSLYKRFNEISKVIVKEDFYAFINAGNNVLRSLEENGRSVNEAKKYLGYLVKHNIM